MRNSDLHLSIWLTKRCVACAILLAAVEFIPASVDAETWLDSQIAQHEQALTQARQTHDQRGQAVELNTLASLYRQAGDPEKGIADCNEALGIERLPAGSLSACSTAKGDVANNGLEVDSLGMIAQEKDAQAVLATLRDVNDASTSQLMSDFYARWMKAPAGNAEALRQAQLALLHGSATAPAATPGCGMQIVPESVPTTAKARYSHPFFWAPFVLTGNYQ